MRTITGGRLVPLVSGRVGVRVITEPTSEESQESPRTHRRSRSPPRETGILPHIGSTVVREDDGSDGSVGTNLGSLPHGTDVIASRVPFVSPVSSDRLGLPTLRKEIHRRGPCASERCPSVGRPVCRR